MFESVHIFHHAEHLFERNIGRDHFGIVLIELFEFVDITKSVFHQFIHYSLDDELLSERSRKVRRRVSGSRILQCFFSIHEIHSTIEMDGHES